MRMLTENFEAALTYAIDRARVLGDHRSAFVAGLHEALLASEQGQLVTIDQEGVAPPAPSGKAVEAMMLSGILTVRVNGLLHLKFRPADFVGLQSWLNDGMFYIEIYLKDAVIKTAYDEAARWHTVLRELDKTLGDWL